MGTEKTSKVPGRESDRAGDYFELGNLERAILMEGCQGA